MSPHRHIEEIVKMAGTGRDRTESRDVLLVASRALPFSSILGHEAGQPHVLCLRHLRGQRVVLLGLGPRVEPGERFQKPRMKVPVRLTREAVMRKTPAHAGDAYSIPPGPERRETKL